MSVHLFHAMRWMLTTLHPDLPAPAREFCEALADAVYEADKDGEPATDVGKIASKCMRIGKTRDDLAAYLCGYDPEHLDRLDTASELARRYGVVRSVYVFHEDRGVTDPFPTYTLLNPLTEALTLATARADVAHHLEAHPIAGPIVCEGVDVNAKRARGGLYPVTHEVYEPTTIDDTVDALVRRVQLGFVGEPTKKVRQPAWLPSGSETARLLREETALLTGVPVPVSPVPVVVSEYSRPVLPDDHPALALLPQLRALPARMRKGGTPSGVVTVDGEAGDAPVLSVVAPVVEEAATKRPAARKRSKASAVPSIAELLAAHERGELENQQIA